MSNPTFATKVATLFKGLFGRKETAAEPAPAAAPAAEPAAAEAAETVTAPVKTEEKEPAAEPAAEETAEAKGTEAEPAEAAEDAKAAEPATATATAPEPETAVETADETPAASEPVVEEKPAAAEPEPEAAAETEPVAPATADLPDSGESIAEEIAVAEAKTEVADSEVLEKVRKENSPAAEDLAVPTYDELTLPSVRARLRKLTVEQVRDLRAYEVAHQGRAEFIKMYDNRIAKLEDMDS